MNTSLGSRPLAVLGFGNQGRAHAALLRRSGLDPIVGARPGGRGAALAAEQGFRVTDLGDALGASDLAAVLLPDEALPAIWTGLKTRLRSGATLVFAHGFNLLHAGIELPARCDVVLVSPTAPGAALARSPETGQRVPAYLAVHQDASGTAWDTAAAYADAIHCGPLWRTTVREETEVDLFGEQAVLCGGMNALVLAAWETLVARGVAPEVAYLECVHQLRYLAELLHDRGLQGFRDSISGTARYGDLTRGPRVIGPESRAAMETILDSVQDGTFARELMAETRAGSPRLRALVEAARRHPIEAARASALGGVPGRTAVPERGDGGAGGG